MKEEQLTPPGIGTFINSEMEQDVKLQDLCNRKNVVLLAFIGSYVPRKYNPASSVQATINMTDEFGMEEALMKIKSDEYWRRQDKKKAYILVNSFGGALSSTFKIAQAIRDEFDDITVFVPHIAASGGTILALTGNTIRMGMMSQLSPVDPQLQYKNHGFVSANSIARAKERLDIKFEKLQEQEVGYPDRHMVEALDPVIYEEFYGIRKASETYISIILKKTGYGDDEVDQISERLIFNLPTHSFVIDRNLAKEIGLKISQDDTDDEEWNLMRDWFAKYVGRETDRHFIRYCIPKIDSRD